MIDAARLFSESYHEARTKFRAAANSAGVICNSHVLPEKGLHGEELAIDVAHFGPSDPRQVMIISSGAHGIEGFAGSAIQVGVLENGWIQEAPDDMAIVLVHALNPHGMSWSRRECEDGTDLPRNLSHHLYPAFPNDEYELFHPFLVPENVSGQWFSQARVEYERILKENGIENATPILRIGQYTHPDGLTYHGRDASFSTRHWIDITRRYAKNADDVMLIDIHTGFGDYGDLLVQNPSYRHDSAAYITLCEWLGHEPYGYSADGSIIEHRIETFEALHRVTRKDARVAAMYFEFGTADPEAFIEPWIRNNWHYHFGDRSSPEAVKARHDFSDFHYVRKTDWKQSVWQKGLSQLERLRERMTTT